MHQQVLAPLLGLCFDDLAPSDEIVRLGRVEIDLGRLSAELLDELSMGNGDTAALAEGLDAFDLPWTDERTTLA